MQAHQYNSYMQNAHSYIYHICKTDIDIVELEIFKFIKIAIIVYFLVQMCLGLIDYFVNP